MKGGLPLNELVTVNARFARSVSLLRDFDIVVLGRLHDVCECQLTVAVGNAFYLVESGQRVPHMRCIDQWLFPLVGKGEYGLR